MNNTILKSILAGILLGGALFVLPFFLLRIALFFLFIGAIFRLFRGPRHWGHRRPWRSDFTDRIRQMSDEEYAEFKQRGFCRPFATTNPQPNA
ncbi:hypothetical protein [Siphonobacter sp. SORGH_AS_1065]|uniref:hypothetical protein n=1 Tax=Siphonobacter sp. SORGH_AS_1065 TaxID=3041795 RepID=UPI00277EB3F1|nr:hypothetical protein [Siphonobacter sp. SORGH_AS_1065]MDQ1087249.1 hypothetical protein [Siphonobacter sp. SORGH_AS_1065]